jgi:hypothetical protein
VSDRGSDLVYDYSPGWIAVSKLHFDMPGLADALDRLGGHDESDCYLIPAEHRAEVITILNTADLIPRGERDAEDVEAVRYGLTRGDQPGLSSHPLGQRIANVPGGTVYTDGISGGTVTIYDRS